jgi:hypothetical protein
MVVDAGAAGLDQSRHHPNAGVSQHPPTNDETNPIEVRDEPEEGAKAGRKDLLTSLLEELRTKSAPIGPASGAFFKLIDRVIVEAAKAATKRQKEKERKEEDNEPITKGFMRELLQEQTRNEGGPIVGPSGSGTAADPHPKCVDNPAKVGPGAYREGSGPNRGPCE